MPTAATQKHKYQAPKGTRDFLPEDLAVRRHLEAVWRDVSVNHGFDEIDGPTFEHLELYTLKSGPGIVSELFRFTRSGGDTEYALRPEMTPTIARLYAASARSLPRPTKWFAMPTMFRAERPQRGRLREHIQWNVDLIGDDSPAADAEIVAVAVAVLEGLGLDPSEVRVKLSHRAAIERILSGFGVPDDRMVDAFNLVDAVAKLDPAEFRKRADALGIEAWDEFQAFLAQDDGLDAAAAVDEIAPVADALRAVGIDGWCDYKPSLARGLAYYTGTVFEIHEARGRERAIAGGGRYDGLVELFGGPPTPAVGVAMGDVVIRLVLEDLGRLEPGRAYLPRPDVFVIEARPDAGDDLPRLVAELRRAGMHTRHSYRTTRNIGKLLGEAQKLRARLAVILADEMETGQVVVKNLDDGTQEKMPFDGLPAAIRPRVEQHRNDRP